MGSSLRRRLASLDRCVLTALALFLVLVLASKFDWNNPWVNWTGFGKDEVKIAIPKIESTEDGQIRDIDITVTLPEKALWDWLELAGIPLVLAGLGYYFQKLEREIAADNLRDEALQAYFDGMSELLLDKGLSSSKPFDPVQDVAKTRTLTVLRRLRDDRERKGIVLRFLGDADLLKVISLRGIDLSGVNLNLANLHSADLRDTGLVGTKLCTANLSNADLSGAALDKSDLSSANLSGATLCKAILSGANLCDANLSGANLEGAYMDGVVLALACLKGANLRDAIDLTPGQVEAAISYHEAKYSPEFREELGLPPKTEGTESSN